MQWSIWWCLMFDVGWAAEWWPMDNTRCNSQWNIHHLVIVDECALSSRLSVQHTIMLCTYISMANCCVHPDEFTISGDRDAGCKQIRNSAHPVYWQIIRSSHNERNGSVTMKNMQEWSLFFVQQFNDEINALYSEMLNDLIQSFQLNWNIGTFDRQPAHLVQYINGFSLIVVNYPCWYTDFSIKMHE